MSSKFFQKNFLAVLFVISCFLPASAQTVAQLMKEGDKNFAEADFYAASQYYKDALKKDDENILLNYKYAESCRTFNDMEGAEKGYRQVIKLDKSNQFPMAIFWLAEVLRSNCECKCDEAVERSTIWKGRKKVTAR